MGILLELREGWLPEVRFTYDRFLEYLLARYLLEKMRREKQDTQYLLELAQKYRQFSTMWGTLQSMLLLNPQMEWWRIMAESTDYVARSIFVDAIQTYFQEVPKKATSIMVILLDDETFYSTQIVLWAARTIGRGAIDVFEHAMKNKSEQTRFILVNLLFSLSKQDLDLYFFLFDHYAALMTPFSVTNNTNMAIGGIQSFLRILLANINNPDILQRCNKTFQEAVKQLHLKKLRKNGVIDRTLQAMTLKVLPLLLRNAIIGGFLENLVLQEDLEMIWTKDAQQQLAQLLPYLDVNQTGIESKLDHLRYILEETSAALKGTTLSILAVQMNSQQAENLDFYRKLFQQCNGDGRSWLQMLTYALFIPTTPPPGYLELLEESTITYVQENREHFIKCRIPLQEIIDCPFLSLYFSYYRETITDMPVIKALIDEAITNNDQVLGRRLVETLFPPGIFYPQFILNFVDQYLDCSQEWLIESVLKGLGLLVSMYPETVDTYIERWQLTVNQQDTIYTNVDHERPYKAYEYLMSINAAEQLFLYKSAVTPLGFEEYNHFVTCNSLDEAVKNMVFP